MKRITTAISLPLSRIFMIASLFFLANGALYAQKPNNAFQKYLPAIMEGTNLKFGLALGQQDRRLFYVPHIEEFLAQKSKLDFEFNFVVQKTFIKTRFFDLDAGFGLTSTNATFSRPFDQNQLGEPSYVFLTTKRYTINKICPVISNRLYPFGKKNRLFVSFDAVLGFDFRKSVKYGSHRLTKWGFHFNSLETYPGLGVRISKRTMLTFAFRNYYVYRLDKVIFNELLFNQRDPAFLKMKYDHYMLKKYSMTIGYTLPAQRRREKQ